MSVGSLHKRVSIVSRRGRSGFSGVQKAVQAAKCSKKAAGAVNGFAVSASGNCWATGAILERRTASTQISSGSRAMEEQGRNARKAT